MGMRIAPRFAWTTTLALAVVLTVFALVLLSTTQRIIDTAVRDAHRASASAWSQYQQGELEFEREGSEGKIVGDGLIRTPVRFSVGPRAGESGHAYYRGDDKGNLADLALVAPNEYASGDPVQKLYGLIFAMTAIALFVAALVATLVASRVARPLHTLADDVRAIANGNLNHRVRAGGGGEVGLLSGAVDRMTMSLREARDAEVELSIREREREVALEVQEALRPTEIPAPDGYDVASEHVGAAEPGGDFHGVVQSDDGRIVYFVCDVSGTGVPGALVGAMARAYLKTAFAKGGSLEETLKGVNRTLSSEVRRGMYVTVLAVALDTEIHELEVASAGHKLPLVHWSADEGAIRAIQPDGIALGFDKGPVFDRGISARRVPMSRGDRIALAGTGAVQVVNEGGEEIGEKRFYKLFAKNASAPPEEALDGLLTALEAFAGDEAFPQDVSVIVLGRSAS